MHCQQLNSFRFQAVLESWHVQEESMTQIACSAEPVCCGTSDSDHVCCVIEVHM